MPAMAPLRILSLTLVAREARHIPHEFRRTDHLRFGFSAMPACDEAKRFTTSETLSLDLVNSLFNLFNKLPGTLDLLGGRN
jgi:hypothetical protein